MPGLAVIARFVGSIDRRAVIPGVLAAAAWLLSCNVLAAAPSAVEEARSAVMGSGAMQTDLPAGEPAADEFQWDWSFQLAKVPPEVYWVLVAAGILVALYYLAGAIPGWRRRGAPWTEQPSGAGLGAHSAGEVALEADALAREGRYDEAVHLLLLKGLADVRRRLEEHFSDSLTSREIAGRVRLSDEGRTALQQLVRRVEWSYFGQHPVGAADYEASRRHFDDLAAALAVARPA